MYLMKLRERYGDAETIGHYIVDEDDPQMVKYLYHYVQKDGGFSDTQYGSKHLLQHFDMGVMTDLEDLRHVSGFEANVLERYLPKWEKP